ncbi:MAG: trypsin-like peptidase domain-containing protein [Bacteroidota bacterium]
MFESAIIESLKYTRPILSIVRNYANKVVPGAATMFFVNNNGVAVTCKHVADLIVSSDNIWKKYLEFQNEKKAFLQDHKLKNKIRDLEIKYGFQPNTTVQILNTFQNCFDKITGFKIHSHPKLDLAIIEFSGFERILYQSHARFIADNQTFNIGKFLCRIGFPFPEFNNFRINEADNLEWTKAGNQNTPIFPSEGMVTRFVGENGEITAIELSTPGLRGQSGGPLFDINGLVYGMQSHTMHLHLGFDMIDHEVTTKIGKEKISNYPFLHVGRCIHANQIKKILQEKGIEYFV